MECRWRWPPHSVLGEPPQFTSRAPGLGASKVIDYTCRDVNHECREYDIITDCVGAQIFTSTLPLLAKGGRFLAINGGVPGSRGETGSLPVARSGP